MSPNNRKVVGGAGLDDRSVRVGGIERGYWLAGQAALPRPLLIVLHGSGIGPLVMARWTGLAATGPAAGFVTVFPDGLKEAWDDTGRGRVDGVDDAAFIAAIVDGLIADGVASAGQVILAGLSNGAGFAEYLARHGRVKVLGLVLVAGTAREASRQAAPRPAQRCGVLLIVGTADRNVPYRGGPATGITGWIARRRMRPLLLQTDGRESVAPEMVAADWAEVNGCVSDSKTESLESNSGDLPVEKLSWGAGCERPVELYRIIGGGHGWPGGPQYAPRALVGHISRSFDATGTVVAFAGRLVDTVSRPE